MVILFDGVCNLCNGFVQFVLKRDKNKTFQFASLQSNYGTELSKYFNFPVCLPETIVLFDGKNILTESDAVLKITSSLNGIWKTTIILYIIPRLIRNWLYRLIARNRYRIFGKRDQCMVPDENIKDRFLDSTSFIHP
jgi:predicted DCC family thiol-disulfide oxidoreductase YuxK